MGYQKVTIEGDPYAAPSYTRDHLVTDLIYRGP